MAKGAYIGIDGVARKVKKGYVGITNFVPRGLPDPYIQLEYIESTGTQYIDTGFKPNQNTRVVADAQYVATSNAQFLFGTRTTSYTVNYSILISGGALRSDYGDSNVSFSGLELGDRYEIDKNKNVCEIGDSSVTNTASTFQTEYSMYLFACNQGGTASYFGKARIYSFKIYDNDTLVRDFVPCVYYGTPGLYDMVNGWFYTNDAGGENFDYGSVAGDWARLIKKAYIGIGGVARPCWAGGELAYYGAITALSAKGCELAGLSYNNYALFGGGYYASGCRDAINAYNKSLTRTTPATLSIARKGLQAALAGDYALFMGGQNGSSTLYLNTTVDAFNKSFTRTTNDDMATTVGGAYAASASVGDKAIRAGGGNTTYGSGTRWSQVDGYDASLTKTALSALTEQRSCLAAATIGDYALFGGGYYGTGNSRTTKVVETFNASFTKGSATSLSLARGGLVATTVGNHALFAGGGTSSGKNTTVDAYDKSLTRTTATSLSSARQYLAAATVEGFALFGGGMDADAYSKVVDAYDTSLTRTVQTSLVTARTELAAASVGNYILFAGGRTASSSYATEVVAYTVA